MTEILIEDSASESEPLSKAATLRRQILEHLVELWSSQDETLRLARQWHSYETATAEAAEGALQAIQAHGTNFNEGFKAALEFLRKRKGLSEHQQTFALRKAVRESRNDNGEDRGYASAAVRNARERRKDMGLLSAQLVTLVADVELFVNRVTSAWLAFDSSHLYGRQKSLSFLDITELDSVEELRDSMVQSYLEDHMRKSASAWFSEFCSLFGVKSLEGMSDFATLEIFQRRHIIVHHGGLVSRQYLSALSKFSVTFAVGDELSVDLEYINRAANCLAIIAHSIASAALYASSTDPSERKDTEWEIGELTYILLNLSRDEVVDRFVSEFDIDRVKVAFSREQLRVNGWIAKRRLGRLSEVRTQIEDWDVSAASEDFKLAKLILLDKRHEAVEMAVQMIEQGTLSQYSVLTWPLFEEIGKDIIAGMKQGSTDVDPDDAAISPPDFPDES